MQTVRTIHRELIDSWRRGHAALIDIVVRLSISMATPTTIEDAASCVPSSPTLDYVHDNGELTFSSWSYFGVCLSVTALSRLSRRLGRVDPVCRTVNSNGGKCLLGVEPYFTCC